MRPSNWLPGWTIVDMQERMKRSEPYVCRYFEMPHELQKKVKKLCWEYNQAAPDDGI